MLASGQARLGTDTDMGLVTTTGQPPVVFCADELASFSRVQSLATNSKEIVLNFYIHYQHEGKGKTMFDQKSEYGRVVSALDKH